MTKGSTGTSETPTADWRDESAAIALGKRKPLPEKSKRDLPHGLTAVYLTHAEVMIMNAGLDPTQMEHAPLWDS